MIFYNEDIFKRCFDYPKRYWYKNIKYIPLYFKQLHHLIKYGYDPYAHWETFDWFIKTMKPILVTYRDNHDGVPIILDDYDGFDEEMSKQNEQMWNGIIDRMIELLDNMDEGNPKYEDMDWKNIEDEKHVAKDEFFRLFSKYFWNLWD